MKENFKKLVKNLEEIGFIGKSEIINNILGENPKDIISSCFSIRDFAGIDFNPVSKNTKTPLNSREEVIKLAEETETLLNSFFITNLTYVAGDNEKRINALRGARHLRNLCNMIASSKEN